MIGRFALKPADGGPEDEVKFINVRWTRDPDSLWPHYQFSSELYFIYPAVWLAGAFGGGVLDIRIMGALHAAVYLAAFVMLLLLTRRIAGPARYLIPAAVILVMGDAAYVTYFDSFHLDAAALVFTACAVAAALHMALSPGARPGCFVVFCAASFLLIASKAQHAIAVLPLGALAVRHALWFRQREPRILGLALAGALPIAFSCRSIPREAPSRKRRLSM